MNSSNLSKIYNVQPWQPLTNEQLRTQTYCSNDVRVTLFQTQPLPDNYKARPHKPHLPLSLFIIQDLIRFRSVRIHGVHAFGACQVTFARCKARAPPHKNLTGGNYKTPWNAPLPVLKLRNGALLERVHHRHDLFQWPRFILRSREFRGCFKTLTARASFKKFGCGNACGVNLYLV